MRVKHTESRALFHVAMKSMLPNGTNYNSTPCELIHVASRSSVNSSAAIMLSGLQPT